MTASLYLAGSNTNEEYAKQAGRASETSISLPPWILIRLRGLGLSHLWRGGASSSSSSLSFLELQLVSEAMARELGQGDEDSGPLDSVRHIRQQRCLVNCPQRTWKLLDGMVVPKGRWHEH